MKILKEPLLHFLLLGIGLFVLFELTASYQDQSEKLIGVDRPALLEYMQYRSRSFDGRFEQVLDRMPEEEKTRLINEYVRQESLYREALAMGMDANDFIIKQRLIQKMEYLARGFDVPQLDEAGLREYYDENIDNYYVDPTITFTHVFVSVDKHSTPEEARTEAVSRLETLRQDQVGFADAIGFGDRFPFHKNYVDRPENFVASHFGTGFAAEAFSLEPGSWHGPVESAYGFHLVLVSRRVEGSHAPIEEVMEQVRYDAQQDLAQSRTDEALDRIVDGYEVVIEL